MRLSKLIERARKQISASVADPQAAQDAAQAAHEKRRSQRFPSPFTAGMLDPMSRPADEAVRLMDMSSIGVGIESTQELSVGQRLGFRMSLSDGFPMNATARVRWAQPWGYTNAYGLEIEGLNRFNRWRLGRFLNPKAFGFVEVVTLLLEAATSIVIVLVAADLVRANPHIADVAFLMMPWVMAIAFGLWVSFLLSFRR